jgi:hypothetical protein
VPQIGVEKTGFLGRVWVGFGGFDFEVFDPQIARSCGYFLKSDVTEVMKTPHRSGPCADDHDSAHSDQALLVPQIIRQVRQRIQNVATVVVAYVDDRSNFVGVSQLLRL